MLDNYTASSPKFSLPPSHAQTEACVQAVIALMRADLRREWKLATLAAQVNLSASHLAHLFKAALGVSIYQYLIGLRMERAGKLLVTTALRVGEVMECVGISDPGHFTQAFKKRYGLTPTEYRRRYAALKLTAPPEPEPSPEISDAAESAKK
jgi:transcriptional regulator GlxA family with amidase domain